jgi:hypothetical protein
MYEIDFLPVGDGARSGDAIAMRFTRPDNGDLAHVIVDAGFEDDGDALVAHFKDVYGTDHADLVLLTHPDKDHRGGMRKVLEGLDVGVFAAHDLAAHDGGELPAAEHVAELRDLALAEGVEVVEPFAGMSGFGEAIVVAGPSEDFYRQMVAEEVERLRTGTAPAAPHTASLAAKAQGLIERILGNFPPELPFGDAGGTNPRNNSSTILDLRLGEDRVLLTADAGAPALEGALDLLDQQGRADRHPKLIQVPHHGSRHNLSRELIERIAGPKGDERRGWALVSISQLAAEDPRYPSPRVTNAFGRRGYRVGETAGKTICSPSADAPSRGWPSVDPLPPLDEAIDQRD